MINFNSLVAFGADPGMRELLVDAGMTHVLLSDAQVVVFNGGADIGTSIYGEDPIGRFIPAIPSRRDAMEIDVFNQFKSPEFLKVGICRGSQLLNCLNGGTLWQDVNNHGQSHAMTVLATGEVIEVTSTHHQMMRPGPGAVILGVADVSTRKEAQKALYPNGIVAYDDDHKDTEIVWYPATSTLCIQGHPEYIPGSRFAEFSIQLITDYFQQTQKVLQHEED